MQIQKQNINVTPQVYIRQMLQVALKSSQILMCVNTNTNMLIIWTSTHLIAMHMLLCLCFLDKQMIDKLKKSIHTINKEKDKMSNDKYWKDILKEFEKRLKEQKKDIKAVING